MRLASFLLVMRLVVPAGFPLWWGEGGCYFELNVDLLLCEPSQVNWSSLGDWRRWCIVVRPGARDGVPGWCQIIHGYVMVNSLCVRVCRVRVMNIGVLSVRVLGVCHVAILAYY